MIGASVTFGGRLGSDPVLRRTQNGEGKYVANLDVAFTPRKRDAEGNWSDAGETIWLRVTVWERLAENVAGSLHKGDAVVLTGRLGVRKYTREDGSVGTELTCHADAVAVDLSFQTVTVSRIGRDVQAVEAVASDAWQSAAA